MSQDELYEHLEGCRRNDRKSQESIYKHFHPEMLSTCRRYTDDAHSALTILNDGFLKAFTQISKFNAVQGSFKSWLKTIIIHTAIDQLRIEKRTAQIIHIETVLEKGNDDFDLNLKYSQEEIAQHLKLLPPITRMVLNLFAFDGFNYKEIAAKLSITESTTRWHIGEARKKLKQSLQLHPLKARQL